MGVIGRGPMRLRNIRNVVENNFEMAPDKVDIWRGKLKWKEGDKFPDADIKERANEYLTADKLYKNRFDGILDYVFSWSDYSRDPMSGYVNMAIVCSLPEFYNITESLVDLSATSIPRIDAARTNDNNLNESIAKTSSLLSNSNFGQNWQDIIRNGYIMKGNKVCKVSKLGDSSIKLVDMPVKNWVPFVNEEDTSTIEVNCFFNIYKLDGVGYCEFMLYHETGKIEKYTFEYLGRPGTGRLGRQIGDVEVEEAFDGAGISPIEVFRGDCSNSSVIGEGQYKYWEASICNCIRAYEAVGILVERAKEIIRVLPDGATKTDQASDITYRLDTGVIVYEGKEAPDVELKLPTGVKEAMDSAIEAYKQSLNRVCRDTGLPITYFDPRELGSSISAKALIATMFRSELKAKRVVSNFEYSLKRLIVKMALAEGIDINLNDFNLIIDSGFVQDEETKNTILQSRVGNQPTMSVADAISAYDGVPYSVAQQRANELVGIKNEANDFDINVTASGDNNKVDGGLSMTVGDENENTGGESKIYDAPLGSFQNT